MTERGPDPDQALIDAIARQRIVVGATVGALAASATPLRVATLLPRVLDGFRRLHAAGATVAVGTDAGLDPARTHDVLPYGMATLARIGMSNAEVLHANTADRGTGHRARRREGPPQRRLRRRSGGGTRQSPRGLGSPARRGRRVQGRPGCCHARSRLGPCQPEAKRKGTTMRTTRLRHAAPILLVAGALAACSQSTPSAGSGGTNAAPRQCRVGRFREGR